MCGTRIGKSQRIVRYSRPLVEDTMANQRVKRGRKVKLSTELGERDWKHAASSQNPSGRKTGK